MVTLFKTDFSVKQFGCPGAHSVEQADLELRDPPASAFKVLTYWVLLAF